MTRADFFFWGLIGILVGTLAASFIEFSKLAQAFVLFIAAAVSSIGILQRRSNGRILLFGIIFVGIAIGLVRTNQYVLEHGWESHQMKAPKVLVSLRSRFEGSLMRSLPEPASSFAAGLLLGRSPSFPQELLDALKRTSTLHLVAVSGYNITVVAKNVMQFLTVIRAPLLVSWWGAVVAVILFTLLVGAPASAVRASIMGMLLLVGKRIGRESPMRIALAFAAAAMVIHRPAILRFDLGFQLSFLATIGIIWLSPVIHKVVFGKRAFHGFTELASDTFGAQLMVAPWLIYKFGTVSLLGIFANLVVLPFIPFAMFWSFMAGFVGMVWDISALLIAPVPYSVLAFSLWAIQRAGRLPFASLDIGNASIIAVITSYVLLTLAMWYGRKSLNSKP